MSWPVFLGVCATILGFVFLVWLSGRTDERRWKREREAEESARHAAKGAGHPGGGRCVQPCLDTLSRVRETNQMQFFGLGLKRLSHESDFIRHQG